MICILKISIVVKVQIFIAEIAKKQKVLIVWVWVNYKGLGFGFAGLTASSFILSLKDLENLWLDFGISIVAYWFLQI